MNPAALLAKQATERGGQIALVDSAGGHDRTITFAGLHVSVENLAAQLRDSGLKAGDAVLVFHPVRIELYTVLLALFRQGITAVFIDPGQGRAFISKCCRLLPLRGFIGSPKAHWLRLLCSAVRRIPLAFAVDSPVIWSRRLLSGKRPEGSLPPAIEDGNAAALITFTSGSTGQPKGIARSHDFLMAQHRALEVCLALDPGGVDLATLPVFVLANLASGLTTVLADFPSGKPGSADGPTVCQQMERWKVTRSAASPAFFQRLLHAGSAPPFVRHLYTGGAPVFPSLMEKLARHFPNARIEAVYGSSEAEPIAHLAWDEIKPRDLIAMRSGYGLLAGRCVDGLDVAVVAVARGVSLGCLTRAQFAAMKLPAGDIGEIVVSGPHVVPGYLNGLGDEETKFQVEGQRWHRTGDTGFFDEDGRIWLTGRTSAIIKLEDGAALYPFQLEAALSFFPEISACALVQNAETIILVVEQEGRQLPSETGSLLERFAVQEVVFAGIPRDKRHNAKVDYPALMQCLKKRSRV